jgi:hypothetical protein
MGWASGYGRYYYFPDIDQTFVVIANFRDGVPVEASQEIYLITHKVFQNTGTKKLLPNNTIER